MDSPVEPSQASRGLYWRSEPECFFMEAPGSARFHTGMDGSLHTELLPGGDVAAARLFAHGLPQAAAGVQRGRLVLHAAALVGSAGAIALAGPSGSGKSVLAAALAQRGLLLLADETLALDLQPGQLPMAHPDDGNVLLWKRAASRLGYDPDRLEQARPGLARVWLPPLPSVSMPQPLVRIYLLSSHNQPEARIEPVRGRERVLGLVRASFNRFLAETPARRRQKLFALAAFPSAVQVGRLVRPELGWSVETLVDLLAKDGAL
jgi:hypothetical protein